MQVTTGGADASQQTGGVGINLVTEQRHQSLQGQRPLLHHRTTRSRPTTSPTRLRAQGAGSGAPIQNIKDYGFEVGGPIKRDKLWYWGSYGKQDIKVGVVGFYKNDAGLPSPGRAGRRHRARSLAAPKRSATVSRPTSRRSTTTTGS